MGRSGDDDLRTRTAAFLFWDTVGSTALLTRLGDQRAEHIRRHLFSVVREVVSANRGEEVKSTGDGLMVVFPLALADSLSCAVGIQRAVAALNGQFADVDLSVRVGVAAGDAVVDLDESDWFGRCVNTSARLCGAAPDGEIYVTAALAAIADWPVEPVGPLDLKGLSEPVDTVRVPWDGTGYGDLATVPPILQPGEGLPFVGRDEQLTVLHRALEPAVEGRATRVTVAGPVGCGKTRLLREWVASISSHARVLGASCAGRRPVEALGAALDSYAAAQPEEQLRVDTDGIAPLVARLAPAISRRFGVAAAHRSADEVEAAAIECLRRISTRGPLVLLLDDADPSHAEWVDRLVATLADSRVLVVSASSTDDASGCEVHVPPFDLAEVDQLLRVASSTPPEAVPIAASLIHAETAGVTLQVVDVINALSQGAPPIDGADEIADAVRLAVTMSCPYRGLKSLRSQDHALFFGREAVLARLIGVVNRSTLAVVTGDSGAGKSSLLLAGLVPSILVGSAGGEAGWHVVRVAPGPDPLESLSAAFGHAAIDGADTDASTILSSLPSGRVLVVVDQLEELWTQTTVPAARRRFLDLLVSMGASDQRDIRVVCGLRSDFFGPATQHAGLRRALQDAQVVLGTPSEDELAQVIEEPAEATGFRLEDALTERLLSDVAGQSGGLPLLSHALYETWRRREGRVLTVAGYEQSGRIEGAIASTAEEVIQALREPGVEQTRRLFGRLVTLGEGRADTRRRVDVDELPPAAMDVAGRFIEARLLTSGDGTLEVAHEALLQHWPRLRGWLDEDRDDLRLHRHLTDAADAWTLGRRDPGDLYRGSRLGAATDLLVRKPAALNDTEREFLDQSTQQSERALARERRRRRAMRGTLLGVSCLLVMALIAGLVAVGQWRRADDEAARALERRDAAELSSIISRASQLATTNPPVALTLAAEAYRRSPGAPSQQALISVLGARQGIETFHRAPVAASGCNGVRDVGPETFHYGDGLTMLALDVASGDVATVGTRPSVCAHAFIGAEEGEISFAAEVGQNRAWITSDPADWGPPIEFDAQVGSYNIDEAAQDGVLVITSDDGLQGGDVFHVATDRTVTPLDTRGSVQSFAPIPGTGLVAAETRSVSDDRLGGEGAVLLLDTASGRRVGEIPLDVSAQLVTASRDGTVLGVVLRNSEVRFYDVRDRTLIAAVPATATENQIVSLALNDDGSSAAVSGGGLVKLLDVATGRELGVEFDAADEGYMALLDGNRVLIDSRGGDALVLDAQSSPLVSAIVDMPNATRTDVRSGGDLAAGVVSGTGVVTRVDLASGDVETIETSESSPVLAAVPVDERSVVGITADFAAVRWIDGAAADRLSLPGEEGTFVLAGDGTANLAAVVGRDPDRRVYTIVVVDFEELEVRAGPLVIDYEELGSDSLGTPAAVPREDGGFVVAVPGEMRFYTDDLKLESVVEYPGDVSVEADLSISSGTDPVVLVASFGELWSAREGADRATRVEGVGAPSNVAIAPDGRRAIVVSQTGLVSLLDLPTGTDLGTVWDGSGALVGEPQWSPDGRQVSIPTLGAVVRLDLDPEVWFERACSLIGTPVSEAEWTANAPTGVDRPHPC